MTISQLVQENCAVLLGVNKHKVIGDYDERWREPSKEVYEWWSRMQYIRAPSRNEKGLILEHYAMYLVNRMPPIQWRNEGLSKS